MAKFAVVHLMKNEVEPVCAVRAKKNPLVMTADATAVTCKKCLAKLHKDAEAGELEEPTADAE